MAQGQNQVSAISLGMQALFAFITYLGTRKTGKTGAEKKELVIAQIEPIFNQGAAIVAGNTSNLATKAEVEAAVQGTHAVLLATGAIHDTAALETGEVTPPPSTVIRIVAPTSPSDAGAPPAEQAKYGQWLRLATPGLMPSNETLKANLYVAGDALYNDGDASNAAEFYFVTRVGGDLAATPPPNSPTGRIAKFAGHVG